VYLFGVRDNTTILRGKMKTINRISFEVRNKGCSLGLRGFRIEKGKFEYLDTLGETPSSINEFIITEEYEDNTSRTKRVTKKEFLKQHKKWW